MLNQVILVGVMIQQYEEKDDTYILLRVNTTHRTGSDSNEVCDMIPCRISNDFKELKPHLTLGAMVGIKAKITIEEDNDKIIIDAQKITFISSRRENSE